MRPWLVVALWVVALLVARPETAGAHGAVLAPIAAATSLAAPLHEADGHPCAPAPGPTRPADCFACAGGAILAPAATVAPPPDRGSPAAPRVGAAVRGTDAAPPFHPPRPARRD